MNIKDSVKLLSSMGKTLDKELVKRLADFYDGVLSFIGFGKSSDAHDEQYYAYVYIEDYYYDDDGYDEDTDYGLYELSSEAIGERIYYRVNEGGDDGVTYLNTIGEETFSEIKRIYDEIGEQEIYDELDEEEMFKLMCSIFANGTDVDSANKTEDLETIFAQFITKKLLTVDEIKSIQKNKNPNQLKMFEQRINKIKKLWV